MVMYRSETRKKVVKGKKMKGGDDDGGDKQKNRPWQRLPALWVPKEDDGGEYSGRGWRMPPGGHGNIDHGDGGGDDHSKVGGKTRKRKHSRKHNKTQSYRKRSRRSIKTHIKHKKSKGRKSRRGGIKGQKPTPILLPTSGQMAHRSANPPTAVREDRKLPGDWLRQTGPGQPPSPGADNPAQQRRKDIECINKGFSAAIAVAQERNQLPPSP